MALPATSAGTIPNWLLQIIVTLLFIANAINIGADLGAMADASKLLIGGPGFSMWRCSATICVTGIVFMSYERYVHGPEMADFALVRLCRGAVRG